MIDKYNRNNILEYIWYRFNPIYTFLKLNILKEIIENNYEIIKEWLLNRYGYQNLKLYIPKYLERFEEIINNN